MDDDARVIPGIHSPGGGEGERSRWRRDVGDLTILDQQIARDVAQVGESVGLVHHVVDVTCHLERRTVGNVSDTAGLVHKIQVRTGPYEHLPTIREGADIGNGTSRPKSKEPTEKLPVCSLVNLPVT